MRRWQGSCRACAATKLRQATAADPANFAGAGVDLMMGETRLI